MAPASQAVETDRFESIMQTSRSSVSAEGSSYCWVLVLDSLLCLAEGCPGLCNGNGRCTLDLNGWHCVCQLGWRGAGCDTSMETACGDSKDNDGGRALVPVNPGSRDPSFRDRRQKGVDIAGLAGHQHP